MEPIQEILTGLSRPHKTISPKFFYDRRGSELFERITELPEYYLTRREISILTTHLPEISQLLGEGVALYELGSGASLKTRLLLRGLKKIAKYVPIDISEEFLGQTGRELESEFPELKIEPLVADFSYGKLPETAPGLSKVVFFPGSTIGNFTPDEAAELLTRVREFLGLRGRLLMGVDLVKDVAVIEAAYNDSQGVTPAFNLNILDRLNRDWGADFQLNQFKHRAFFNPQESRIEMHLVASVETDVQIADRAFHFEPGETIHTESSYKYRIEGFESLAANAGFTLKRVWTDEDHYFGVFLLEAM